MLQLCNILLLVTDLVASENCWVLLFSFNLVSFFDLFFNLGFRVG
jgi:hypothetical protein